MPVEKVMSHPKAWENAGKVALQRGPLVYCLEEEDNGPELHNILYLITRGQTQVLGKCGCGSLLWTRVPGKI